MGVRGKDIVYLNLHERAHGPHGLCRWNNGIWEVRNITILHFIVSIKLSPEDIGFLPIDFKGGGMANLFKDLPHLDGCYHQLRWGRDPARLASIKAVLQKRSAAYLVDLDNHINGYTKIIQGRS